MCLNSERIDFSDKRLLPPQTAFSYVALCPAVLKGACVDRNVELGAAMRQIHTLCLLRGLIQQPNCIQTYSPTTTPTTTTTTTTTTTATTAHWPKLADLSALAARWCLSFRASIKALDDRGCPDAEGRCC